MTPDDAEELPELPVDSFRELLEEPEMPTQADLQEIGAPGASPAILAEMAPVEFSEAPLDTQAGLGAMDAVAIEVAAVESPYEEPEIAVQPISAAPDSPTVKNALQAQSTEARQEMLRSGFTASQKASRIEDIYSLPPTRRGSLREGSGVR